MTVGTILPPNGSIGTVRCTPIKSQLPIGYAAA